MQVFLILFTNLALVFAIDRRTRGGALSRLFDSWNTGKRHEDSAVHVSAACYLARWRFVDLSTPLASHSV